MPSEPVAPLVPAGPINDLAAVFADPQVRSREMKIQLPHPLLPDLAVVGNPLQFDG